MKEYHHSDFCDHCGGYRDGVINKKTGEYLCHFPFNCEDEDRCIKEFLHGFEFQKTAGIKKKNSGARGLIKPVISRPRTTP